MEQTKYDRASKGNELHITSELYITQINSMDVSSNKAIVTLSRVSTQKIEFETHLRFPVYANVVCRFILPHPEEALHLEAVFTRCLKIRGGIYRYSAAPLSNDKNIRKLAGVINHPFERFEKFFQMASKAYSLLDPKQQDRPLFNQII
ncbi:hypothetical protein ACFCP7_03670 [Paenibacillus elgii]